MDLIGVSKLTNAFGLLLLFQGLASLTSPPLVGLIYDLTRSYNEGFVFSGVAIAMSGLMLYFVPFLRQKHVVIDLNWFEQIMSISIALICSFEHQLIETYSLCAFFLVYSYFWPLKRIHKILFASKATFFEFTYPI